MIIDTLQCNWGIASFFIISDNVFSPLIYYSHLVPLILSLFLGLFIYINDSKSIVNRSLFFITITFALWAFCDLALWADEKTEHIMFFWSITNLLEPILYAACFYFLYLFVNKKLPSISTSTGIFILLLPVIILTPTNYGIIGFNYTNCDREVYEGIIAYYSYIIEIIFIVWITLFSIVSAWKKPKDIKKQIWLVSGGVLCFLLFFSVGNIAGTFTDNWSIGQYGLFGMPIFVGFLSYLIVRFNAFNTKLLGAQALVVVLLLLVASLLLVQDVTLIHVITAIITVLLIIFGIFLILSVKREVAQREYIEKINKDLEDVTAKQADLLYFVTHQIKGFFATSRNALSLILEGDYGDASPTVKNVLKTVLDSDTSGVAMVQTFLNASKLSDGQIEFKFETTDIKSMVEEVITQQKSHIESRGLTLTVSMPDPTYVVSIDRTQMREVIYNTIDNAIRYTIKGGITVSLSHVVHANGTKSLLYSVADTGVGIDPLDMPKLFKKNGRGKDSRLVNPNSNGYGLFIVKNVVEAHHGRVWVESKGKDQGSTFFVELAE